MSVTVILHECGAFSPYILNGNVCTEETHFVKLTFVKRRSFLYEVVFICYDPSSLEVNFLSIASPLTSVIEDLHPPFPWKQCNNLPLPLPLPHIKKPPTISLGDKYWAVHYLLSSHFLTRWPLYLCLGTNTSGTRSMWNYILFCYFWRISSRSMSTLSYRCAGEAGAMYHPPSVRINT